MQLVDRLGEVRKKLAAGELEVRAPIWAGASAGRISRMGRHSTDQAAGARAQAVVQLVARAGAKNGWCSSARKHRPSRQFLFALLTRSRRRCFVSDPREAKKRALSHYYCLLLPTTCKLLLLSYNECL